MLQVWQWVSGHSGILAAAGVAVLDLVFALVPSLAGNGVLHWLLVRLQLVANPNVPQASPPSA